MKSNDDGEYGCSQPPVLSRRKKSVSRISSSSETRLSSSLFSFLDDEGCEQLQMDESDTISLSSSFSISITRMSPSPEKYPLHDEEEDRVSPISVMDVMYDSYYSSFKENSTCGSDSPSKRGRMIRGNFPPVPDLVSSFDTEESSMLPGTPSPKRNRQKIHKWSSFHEDGRDWGISEQCDSNITQNLLQMLTMMEEEEENLQDE